MSKRRHVYCFIQFTCLFLTAFRVFYRRWDIIPKVFQHMKFFSVEKDEVILAFWYLFQSQGSLFEKQTLWKISYFIFLRTIVVTSFFFRIYVIFPFFRVSYKSSCNGMNRLHCLRLSLKTILVFGNIDIAFMRVKKANS